MITIHPCVAWSNVTNFGPDRPTKIRALKKTKQNTWPHGYVWNMCGNLSVENTYEEMRFWNVASTLWVSDHDSQKILDSNFTVGCIEVPTNKNRKGDHQITSKDVGTLTLTLVATSLETPIYTSCLDSLTIICRSLAFNPVGFVYKWALLYTQLEWNYHL